MIKRISRREFTSSMALAAGAVVVSDKDVWAQKAPSSVVEGVQLGVQTYSFRDRPLDEAIAAMIEVGVNSCELWQGHLEPQKLEREALRKWRLETPLSHYKEAGQKLKKAGIQLSAYNYSFKKDMTDEELERGFHMAKGPWDQRHHSFVQPKHCEKDRHLCPEVQGSRRHAQPRTRRQAGRI